MAWPTTLPPSTATSESTASPAARRSSTSRASAGVGNAAISTTQIAATSEGVSRRMTIRCRRPSGDCRALATFADILEALQILIALFNDLLERLWVVSHEPPAAMQPGRRHRVRNALDDKDARCRRQARIGVERLEGIRRLPRLRLLQAVERNDDEVLR